MNTYTIEEVLEIRGVIEELTGCGYDYDLDLVIRGNKERFPDDTDKALWESFIEYLSMCPHMISQGLYLDKGIDNLIYETPLSELPLYLGYTGEDILKRIVAIWRLKLGK